MAKTPKTTAPEFNPTDEANAPEPLPTREEAKAMFEERPSMTGVMTDEGWVNRGEC